MAVNLTTLSKILEVSPGTISRVLNGSTKQRISEDRRRFILEGAKKYGYKPNAAARSLVMQKTFNVCFLQHTISDGSSNANPNHLIAMMSSLEKGLHQQHYGLNTRFISRDKPEWSFSQLLQDHRSFDAVVFPPGVGERGMLSFAQEAEIPYAIVYDKRAKQWPGNFFDIDWVTDAQIIVEHLLEQGHKKIGVVDWDSRGRLAPDTLSKDIVDLLQGQQLPIRDEWILTITDGDDEFYSFRDYGREAMKQILSCQDQPTALIASTDMMALGLLDVMNAHGLQAGRDMAVVGFGNIEGLSSISKHKPVLTTLEPSFSEIGKTTANVLVDQLADKTIPCQRKLFPSRLVVRSSTMR